MKTLIWVCLFFLFLSPAVRGQDKIEISLKNGSRDEEKTKEQLERLLKSHDLSKWIFTRSIIIEENVIPHSHPILTLSTRHLKDDELLLSTFVHEQIHWFVIEDRKKLAGALDEIRKMFPEVPAGPPDGARDEDSTYLHIPVVYLEYRANRELLGELKARQVMEFWANDHYRWIYKTVLERPRDIGQIMFKHKLIPSLADRDSSAPNDEKGFITVDPGTRIFYEKVGRDGPATVIPLHLFLFDDFRHLAKNRTLIFYDVRNRGRSDRVEDKSKITIQEDVEDLEKLRKHFGLKKFSLIGESYVGLLVVMYAMKYPQYVEKIVQIGPVPLKFGTDYPKEMTAGDEDKIPDPAELAKLDELRQRDFHKTNPQEFCEKDWLVSRTGLVGVPANAAKIKSVCHLPNEWPVNLERHFGSHFVSVQNLDIPKEEVARVTVPVLTIHGTKDRNAPYGAGREWSQMLPGARLLTVEGAAHFPWIDRPDLVFSAIDEFLPDENESRESKAREVFFKARDGITIYADIYQSPKGRSAPLIMLFHQGGGDARGEYAPIVPKLAERGYNLIAVDLRTGGRVFGGENRTVAGLSGKEFSYCDAYPDLEATLDFVKAEGFTGKRIAWGSSFSAALAFRLAAERGRDLAGLLAFSPASGEAMEGCRPETLAERIKIPALALRPATEMQRETSQNQFAVFKKNGIRTYVAANGVHGSSMLVESRIEGDAEDHWKVVGDFIQKILAE